MKTYIFVETNGNATITLSAEDSGEAEKYLNEITRHPHEWRLDDEMEED